MRNVKLQFNQLNGNQECLSRRACNMQVQQNGDQIIPLKESQAVKEVIPMIIRGELNEKDLERYLSEMIGDVYINPYQNRIKIGELKDRILRATNDIKDMISVDSYSIDFNLPAITIPIKSSDGDNIYIENVRPDGIIRHDYLSDNGQVIFTSLEAFIWKIGRAKTITGKSYSHNIAEKEKQLYCLMKYAEEYARCTSGIALRTRCTGAYYFLKKDNDSSENRHYHFFTNNKGDESNNIIKMEENYNIDASDITEYDTMFSKLFKEYKDGKLKEECTAKQCKYCDIEPICHYIHPPVALKLEKEKKPLNVANFTDIQNKIANFNEGFCLVVAGPGSGKSTTLNTCITYLLLSGVAPSEILSISFSQAAAEVSKTKLQDYNDDFGTGEDLSELNCCTFNGFCMMVAQDCYKQMGYKKQLRVIKPSERIAYVAELLRSEPQIPGLDYRNFDSTEFACKGALITAVKVFELIKIKDYTFFDAETIAKEDEVAGFCTKESCEQLCVLYDKYDEYMKAHGLIEFADQENIALQVFQEDPYYLEQYGYKYIFIDEGQDTSPKEMEILKALKDQSCFVGMMMVGDYSQSIYSFRYTDPKNFKNFESILELPKGTVKQISMMENFRSREPIVNFANKIIEKNEDKMDDIAIVPTKTGGEPVYVQGYVSKEAEYDAIVTKIVELVEEKNVSPSSIAFIASNRSELNEMADRLSSVGMPSVMLNPEIYSENSRVIAAMAFIRCLKDVNDTKDIMIALNAQFGGTLLSLSRVQIKGLILLKQREIETFWELSEADKRKYFFSTLMSFDEEDEIYQSFINSLKFYQTMREIFNYIDVFARFGKKEEQRRNHSYPGIVLTTAHSSKGMEFPIVFNSLSKYVKKNKANVEEQRRLLYVSSTRAMEKLYISGVYIAYGSKSNRVYNNFLMESYEAVGKKFDISDIEIELKAYQEHKKELKKQQDIADAAEIISLKHGA